MAASCGQATVKQQKLNPADIPGEIPWQGDLIEGYRYTDNTGENIVITTESDVLTNAEEEYETSYKQIWAHRFIKHKDSWDEVWKLYDIEDNCENYPVARFVNGALSITDIDGNGTAEIWLMYVKSCKGDVSSDDMFLRMYDNEEIYTMTGETRLTLSDGASKETYGGEYTFDDRFLNKNTKPAFVEFAKTLWEKHIEGK